MGVTTHKALRKSASAHEGRAPLTRRVVVAMAITAAAAIGLLNGIVQGTTWAEAAERIAYWTSRGTGSVGWMDQLGAGLALGFGGFLIALAGGLVIRLALPRDRAVAMVALIGITSIALIVGFLGMTEVGGELGYEPAELPAMNLGTLSSVSLGAVAGYGFGSVLMRSVGPDLATRSRSR